MIHSVFCISHSSPFPRVFSSCNVQELKSFLSSGGGKCLFNLPNTHKMYGGQRCGNGYLEEGEECDCGEEEVCGFFLFYAGGIFSHGGFCRPCDILLHKSFCVGVHQSLLQCKKLHPESWSRVRPWSLLSELQGRTFL